MKTMIKTLAVTAGLLAIPFGAFAETAVTDSHAATDAVWEETLSGAEANDAVSGAFSSMDASRTDGSAEAMAAHVAIPANAWAGNFRAGLVFEPSGD